jgi:Tn3 transposase DDE domain
MSRNAAPLNGGLARAREPAADRREVWDNVLRLTASVRTGTVSASLMLKRLGASHGKTGWRWPCAKSAGSSAPCSRSTGWKIRNCGGRRLNKGEEARLVHQREIFWRSPISATEPVPFGRAAAVFCLS